MRTFRDYILREDEITLKVQKIPRNPSYTDSSMSYYMRRMSKQNKQQSNRPQMKEL